MNYAELHLHTCYSPLDGLSTEKEYMSRAHEIGVEFLAKTDHGTMVGTRQFQQAAKEAGITPIIGIEAYFSETDRFDKRGKAKRQDGTNVYNHIILLAKNDQGVIDLNTLSEIGWTEGFYKKPRIDMEVLDQYGDNLIVLSGCMSGVISKPILKGNHEEAIRWTKKLYDRFGEDFYIEIQSHNPPHLNNGLLDIADQFGIKPVITGDCHYADPADKAFEEAFLILGTNPDKRENPDMSKANKMDLLDRLNYLYPKRGLSFNDIDVFLERAAIRHEKLQSQIVVPFNIEYGRLHRTDIFENTLEVAQKIGDYEYKENEYTLPRLNGIDTNAKMREICENGLKLRGLWGKAEYRTRLEEELQVIFDKNLASYFIILWDALVFCRKNNIGYGFGRGSAAGSLACYAMEITEVDPVEHNLLFWRFLDPERADLPDIDTDIQDTRRLEVKHYLAQKYGADKVASVSTYGTYKGKSAINAACRVLNIDYKLAQTVNKLLTDYVEKNSSQLTLEEYRNHPKLEGFRKTYPDVLRIAEKIADRLSQYGMHAGGVIITDKPLAEYTALESRQPPGQTLRQKVTAVDGDAAAEIGLVKYDFLGLKTLSVIADAVQFIKDNHAKSIDWKHLREDDPNVLKMISDGHTTGIFQAEAEASTQVIKELGIDSFRDLVVSNALVRPGAWKAFGKEYIARKKGYKRVNYPTVDSKEFLEDTYGFYLYQEQTMQLCTEVAGMTKGDANKVRKLTAKKKSKEELQPFKEKFFAGALQQVSQAAADKLWADIELTAEYSFNKCLAEDTTVWIRATNPDDGIAFDSEYSLAELQDNMQRFPFWKFEVRGPEFINGEKVGPETWHEIKTVHDNGVQDIYRIWVDSKTYIDATAMHKHRLAKNWKEAFRIYQNDVIWTDQGKRKVWKRSFESAVQTYDIELYDEPHAFYANGFLTHNSHAVAYSKLSYVAAWLKYYYPAEFMTAILNNESDTGSISQYLAEAKRLKLRVNTPDVNNSQIGYSCKGNNIYMGLANIKNIGEKKAEHIIANRPYESYADLEEKVRKPGTGLDIRTLASLNAIGATKFPDHKIDQAEVRANFYEYLGIPSFDTGQLSQDMQSRLTSLSEFDGTTVAVVGGIVQEIVSKPTWTKVSIVDETGTASFFVTKDHGLTKGSRYLMVLDKNSLVMHMDMSSFDPNHPIIKHLRRAPTEPGTYAVAAKARTTKTDKKMATLVYSHNGILKTCVAFESHLDMARREFKLGRRVRIALKQGRGGGDILDAVKLYE